MQFLRRCFDRELWVKRWGSFESSSAVNKISTNTTLAICHTVFARTHSYKCNVWDFVSQSACLPPSLFLWHAQEGQYPIDNSEGYTGLSISTHWSKIHKQKPIDRLKVVQGQGHSKQMYSWDEWQWVKNTKKKQRHDAGNTNIIKVRERKNKG